MILTFLSYYWAITDWQKSVICYFVSFTLDYFDGLFARMLNQSKSPGGETEGNGPQETARERPFPALS